MTQRIKEIISTIDTYSDDDLQILFDTEKLEVLHKVKLYFDDIYYNIGDDTIEDYKYDMLKETLDKRDPNYIVPIGAKIKMGEKRVELPFWLGSMDKFKPENKKEILRWVSKNKATKYIVEDKLDGVSCLIIYKNNKITLYTRGDGIVGSDVSHIAQFLRTIPKKVKGNIAIRGELIIPKKVFEKKYSKNYANPRNMVPGIIRPDTKNVQKNKLKDIDFVAYEIVGDGTMKKQSDQLDYLDTLGFTTVRRDFIPSRDITIEKLVETLICFKETSPYEIDGIIVQPDEPYERNVGGNPEYAFAFKMRFGDNIKEAEVVGVEWNITKWGVLKPRVQIKPIPLGGVTITWATGFNARYISNNEIGPGTIIKITRSGDVIPYIIEVVKATEAEMPDIPYEWNESEVDIYTELGGDTMCVKLIASFFAKLGIKFVGESTIRKMYENDLNNLLKIIGASKSDFLQIFGEKTAERTHTNIQGGLKNLSIPMVLGASSVFGFGIGRKRIISLMDDIPDLLTLYKQISNDKLYNKVMKVEGFSDKTALKITDNVRWADKLIQEMSKYATFKSNDKLSDDLVGMKFVMSGFRDKKLEEDIVSRGGKTSTSVSKNTKGVIVVSKAGQLTGKPKKALDLGVPLYTKEEFIEKFIS